MECLIGTKMKETTKQSYIDRINKVLTYIEQHLDDDLNVKTLSGVAYLSVYHFHRIFSAFTDMSLAKYVQYMRLRQAAYQLIFTKDISIVDIALKSGFGSHEAFCRAFKRHCGLSPSEFRKQPQWKYWQSVKLSGLTKRNSEMNIEIREIEPIRVATLRHRGSSVEVNNTAEKFISWAKANNFPMSNGRCYGIAYDDPETTTPAEFRFDFCLSVQTAEISGDDIYEETIPGGRYAVCHHVGSHDIAAEKLRKMYRNWLPSSNEELRDQPAFFRYLNLVTEVPASELITEIYLPLV